MSKYSSIWILFMFLFLITAVRSDDALESFSDDEMEHVMRFHPLMKTVKPPSKPPVETTTTMKPKKPTQPPQKPPSGKPNTTTTTFPPPTMNSTTNQPTTITQKPTMPPPTSTTPISITNETIESSTTSEPNVTSSPLSTTNDNITTTTSQPVVNGTKDPLLNGTTHEPDNITSTSPVPTTTTSSTPLPSTTSSTTTWNPPPTPVPTTDKPPIPITHFTPPPSVPTTSTPEKSNDWAMIVVAVCVPLFIILCLGLLCLGFFIYRRKQNPPPIIAPPKKNDVGVPPVQVKQKLNNNLEKPMAVKVIPIEKPRKRSIVPHPPAPVATVKAANSSSKENVDVLPIISTPFSVEHAKRESKANKAPSFVPEPDLNSCYSAQKEDDNPLAAVKIPAENFIYKGPLVLKKYNTVDLHHELEDEPERKVLDNEHISFDSQHQVYEMGSEVELVISNRSKASLRNPRMKTEPDSDEVSKSSKSKKGE